VNGKSVKYSKTLGCGNILSDAWARRYDSAICCSKMSKNGHFQGSHYILVVKFKDFSKTFKDPEVACSRTTPWWKCTAWTVLQQYL